MASENAILTSVLQRAASDAAFREAFKANPAAILAEAGLQTPEGLAYEIVEDTTERVHIVLPPLAEEDELGGEALEARATKSALLCVPGPANAVTAMPVCWAS